MDHTDMEEALAVLAGFPFFAELSEIDKMALFNRFWMPFSLLERIYDTLNTLDSASTMDGDFIVLQNGSVFDLNGLLKASNPTILEKTAFEAWHMLVPLMKKIEPHCLEVMYIFCCILWNTSYLDSPISKDGEEVIRRGRLIIHKEMREFYDYDEIQWERIYALRHVLIQTEKCVEEYKKAN
uniref:NR LBD domain-containing protein n=1 Tax=Panagrolaimus sp. ES5 TaxID=591445 RepID=A0AC34F031_9BILA